MIGYTYSRRSTIGYAFTIGGTIISWISKLQIIVELTRMQEKHVVATNTSKRCFGYRSLSSNWKRRREI